MTPADEAAAGRRERPPSGPSPSAVFGLRRRLAMAALLAFAVYVGLLLYGDWSQLGRSLVAFPWLWLPAIIGLVLFNYAGRWLKWLWYLRLIGSPIRLADATRAFGIGFAMVLTPGKVGEFAKSFVVRHTSGTPLSASAPIVVAERLSDGLAMAILAAIGLLGASQPGLRRSSFILFAAMATIVVGIWLRPLAMAILGAGEHWPLVARRAQSLRAAYESAYVLLGPRNLAIAVTVGVGSWLGEGLAYYLIVEGVRQGQGAAPTIAPGGVLAAVSVFSLSTLLGAALATPGGLGTIEASLVGLGELVLGLGRTEAVAAALLARFTTLWFGVALGMVSLALWWPLLVGPPASAQQPDD